MATVALKGLSLVEMRLLTDFSNTVTAREYSNNVTIQKLTLSYDQVNGFTIDLAETSNIVPSTDEPTA